MNANQLSVIVISMGFRLAFLALIPGVFLPESRAQDANVKLDNAGVCSSVLKTVELVNKTYFDVEVARQINNDVQARLKDGQYRHIKTTGELATHQGRAVIIGALTAGAANPGKPYRVNDWFEVTIPNGKIRAAVSGKNWEGVAPDVLADRNSALDVAHRLALKNLIEQTTDLNWRPEIEKILKSLEPK